MEIFRDVNTIAGFRFVHPWDGWEALTHCGEQTCNRRHYVPPHHHDAFELFYLLRGRVAWQISGTTFVQEPGALFIVHPGEQHGSAERSHGGYHKQFLGVRLETLGDAGAQLAYRLRTEGVHLVPDCYDFEAVIRGLIRQVVAQEPGSRQVATAYLTTLVALLAQRLDTLQAPGRTRNGAPYSYPIEKAIRYMAGNLDRRLPLPEVAAVAGYGLSQFCLRFREEVRVSPAAYHLELRLQAARDALRQPGVTVTFVALAYGFRSAQHFTTAFRKAFGLPPCRWQRRTIGPAP